MYKSFYQLKEKPFQISTDPKFLWLGEKHREALATLKYGVLDNKGFLLITGDVGTGKTTLINALVSSFGNKVIYATISDPALDNLDFFKYIAHVFKFDRDFENKGDFLIHFSRFLINTYRKRKTVVLIIDEAQLLTQELLEQIRLLSNIEKQQRKLINIFFVGQSEFNDTLLKHENRALRQRITINYSIDPLSASETGEYIKHRLLKAGSTQLIFNSGAIKKIHSFSRGYPRLINIICDHAMLTGFVKEARTIDAAIIKECIKELHISQSTRGGQAKKATNPPPGSIQYQAPAKRAGVGRGLTYLLLVVLLALVASLALKIGSSPKGLIEAIDTLLERPGSVVPGNDAYTEPVKIKDRPASGNTGFQNVARLAVPNEQAGPESSRLAEPPLKTGTRPAGAPPGVTPDRGAAPAHVSEEIPHRAYRKSSDQKAPAGASPDGPPENIPVDPVVRAREFIARTGGKLTIHFSYNSNEILKPEFDRLTEFADIVTQTPEMMIIITGHTDTSGSVKYNQKLSQFRANIVKSYFVGKGVNPENIISIGKGLETPLIKSAAGIKSLSNRRVEIELKLVHLPERP